MNRLFFALSLLVVHDRFASVMTERNRSVATLGSRVIPVTVPGSTFLYKKAKNVPFWNVFWYENVDLNN